MAKNTKTIGGSDAKGKAAALAAAKKAGVKTKKVTGVAAVGQYRGGGKVGKC